MNVLLPTFLLTLPAESGTLALALYLSVLTTVFTLGLERRRSK
jgi:hypothetical protein